MTEFIGRQEHDDIVRHLTTKLDKRDELIRALLDQVVGHEAAIVAAHFSIRLLGRLLRPLLPEEEQRELLDLEARAGVTDSSVESVHQVEPGDGAEWRERLRERVAASAEKAKRSGFDAGPFPADEVGSAGMLGALFDARSPNGVSQYDRGEVPPFML